MDWQIFYKATREGNEEALRLYYKAINLDPDFSTAYAAAAACIARRKALGRVIDREDVVEAKGLALRAVQLGKDDVVALGFAGHTLAFLAGELDDGAAFLDRALLLNPNFAQGGISAAGSQCGSANQIGPLSALLMRCA